MAQAYSSPRFAKWSGVLSNYTHKRNYVGPRMDLIGWYIATLHDLLGHDIAAAVLGVHPGDKAECLICAYERQPIPERKRAVEAALARPRT